MNKSSAAAAVPVRRGCGLRREDGVYCECGLSPYGSPLETFVLDPPIPLPSDVDVSPLGVTLVEGNGVTYIIDWVGGEYYPSVADFLEEVRRAGLSRRLPKNLDFSRLSEKSRILLVHARAGIENWREYPERIHPCPRGNHKTTEFCAGLWWEDVEGTHDMEPDGLATRDMPSFSYQARTRPPDVPPDYEPMFFASFPISRLVVVNGENAEKIAAAIQKSTKLEVAVVDA